MKNKHGVEIVLSNSGRFGYLDETTGYFKTHNPIEVPVLCTHCKFFEHAEYSEGETLAPPCCRKNIYFPTRKGTCKGHQS